MKPTVIIAAVLLLAVGAHASEVFKSTDPQGRPVYTDKPQTLPAQKLDVRTATTDTVEVQQRYEAEMKRLNAADEADSAAAAKAAEARKAKELTEEDRARRCVESRQRYESYMNARRLYEPGSGEGERRYLSDAELDAARANARQAMDEFCGGR
jgi:hypothetical protein